MTNANSALTNANSTVASMPQPTAISTAISLASSAMLSELSISKWTGTKRDKKASEEVTADKGAKRGVARVNKDLLADNQHLAAINTFVGSVRNMHYAMTMPWSDTGLRLLPTAQYFKYHNEMTGMQQEFDRLVNTFLNEYEYAVMDAKLELGALFNADDYPTTDALRSKFAFRISYVPLPDVGDFRVDIGNEATAQLRADYESYYSTQINNAMRDIWERLHKSLTHMSDKLTEDADSDKKKRFHASLVTNLLEVVDLLDTCNVTGDSQMSALRDQLDTALRGVTVDALKEDSFLRATTKTNIDAALKALPSLDF